MLRSSNPRILFLTGQLGSGGSEHQLFYLVRELQREQYRPAVVVWHYSEKDVYVNRIKELGIPLIGIDGEASRISKFRALRRIVGQLKPEVIHSYSFYTNGAAWFAARGSATVGIGSIRGGFIEEKEDSGLWLSMPSSRWPRHQICNSFAAAENVKYTRGVFMPLNLSVVPNGLDLARYKAMPPPTEGNLILGIGSLFPRKRWDRLLTAAAALMRRGLAFQVQIAGDGPLRSSLESQARELDVGDRIRFLGNIDVVEEKLQEASFLAHTSDSEGCPNAVMEAMACGRPVVATDSGDVPLLVDHGKTGFVVRRGDDAALVDHLQTMLTNAVLRREMGVAARLKAEREFGLKRLVSETLNAYRNAGWQDSGPHPSECH
jgi:glycosyltransferase involved in cell wall biosynthesis